MAGKSRVAATSGLVAFAAGFLLATFLQGPQSERGRLTNGLLEVGPENGIITVDRLPPGWPRLFPLPKYSQMKWAVASEGHLWACFTFQASHGGGGAPRLLRFFREQLRVAGYQTGATTETQEAPGHFVGKLGFLRNNGLDHQGSISVPLTQGALRLGGIPCSFSVEVEYFPR